MEMIQKLKPRKSDGKSMGLFRCPSCNEAVVKTRSNGNRQRSCGCSYGRRETHGLHKHPLYRVWTGMVQRCENPTRHEYPRYGERGISVCDEWRQNVSSFVEWALANGWEKGLHIDRVDNEAGYSPENCRIVTARQNNRNRRTNKLSFELAEQIRKRYAEGPVTQTQIAKELDIHPSVISLIVRNKIWRPVSEKRKEIPCRKNAQSQ